MASKKVVTRLSTVAEAAKQLGRTEAEVRAACSAEQIGLVESSSTDAKPKPRKLTNQEVDRLRKHFEQKED